MQRITQCDERRCVLIKLITHITLIRHMALVILTPRCPVLVCLQRIPAGTVILCTTEVERIDDRKVWMKATVSDGKRTVYATGRALFVAPRWLPTWLSGGKRKA